MQLHWMRGFMQLILMPKQIVTCADAPEELKYYIKRKIGYYYWKQISRSVQNTTGHMLILRNITFRRVRSFISRYSYHMKFRGIHALKIRVAINVKLFRPNLVTAGILRDRNWAQKWFHPYYTFQLAFINTDCSLHSLSGQLSHLHAFSAHQHYFFFPFSFFEY